MDAMNANQGLNDTPNYQTTLNKCRQNCIINGQYKLDEYDQSLMFQDHAYEFQFSIENTPEFDNKQGLKLETRNKPSQSSKNLAKTLFLLLQRFVKDTFPEKSKENIFRYICSKRAIQNVTKTTLQHIFSDQTGKLLGQYFLGNYIWARYWQKSSRKGQIIELLHYSKQFYQWCKV